MHQEQTLERIDIDRFIDRNHVGGYQVRLAVLCGLSVLMDGFDAQSMGYVAPALAAQWHIQRPALGPVLSAGLAGMLVGALVFGPLADRFGRKRILMLCTLWFGVMSLLAAMAWSPESMLVLRLLTGFGLGGTLPNAVSLTAEYMPRRLRATGVMIMFTGFSIGAATGGFASAGLIANFGWRSVFVAGGILPCIVAIFLTRLPESIRFLVLKGDRTEQVAEILRKLAPGSNIANLSSFFVSEPGGQGFPVRSLFTEGRAKVTLLLWLMFFVSMLDLFFLNGWLPTVLHSSGIALQQAILITAMFQVAGAVASPTLGYLIDRTKSYRVVVWAYLGASAAVFLIGMAGSSVALQMAIVFAAGYGYGAQNGGLSLAAELYPTEIRSTGTGWVLGIGRVGSIAGPILGGIFLGADVDVKQVFWVAAIPTLIAAAAAYAVSSPKRSTGDPISELAGEKA